MKKMKTIVLLLMLLGAGVLLAQESESETRTITTLGGKVYTGAKVTKVEPGAITVLHDSGIARIALRELPEELRAEFGYDAERAAEYEAAKREENAAILKSREEAYRRAKLRMRVQGAEHEMKQARKELAPASHVDWFRVVSISQDRLTIEARRVLRKATLSRIVVAGESEEIYRIQGVSIDPYPAHVKVGERVFIRVVKDPDEVNEYVWIAWSDRPKGF